MAYVATDFTLEWYAVLFIVAVFVALRAVRWVRTYLLLPLRIRHKGWIGINRRYEHVELTQLPADIARPFLDTAPQLAALGFEAVAHLRSIREMGLSGDSIVSLWSGPGRVDRADVFSIKCGVPKRPPKLQGVVSFWTDFTDGTAIATTNRASAPVFKRDAGHHAVVCPGLQDLSRLYSLHRARVERSSGARTVLPVEVEAICEKHRQLSDRMMHLQVSAGYYVLDAGAGVYRKTVRGTFALTWKLLWPWKQIIRRREVKKLRRVVAELGLGPLEQFLPSLWAPIAPPPAPTPALQRFSRLAAPSDTSAH